VSPLTTLQPVVSVDELKAAIEELPNGYICRELMSYISSLVEATRTYPRVTLGVSPRGALALMRAAKGYAAIAGRNYVLPDDIKRAAHPVLEHRLQLENSLRIRKNAAAEIIDDILGKTTVPTEAVFEAHA
ncbi:MAG: AAA family ATPase, partial [Clostridia bacterium]|nr:AAA family ATPase [Clostridia bacterium]